MEDSLYLKPIALCCLQAKYCHDMLGLPVRFFQLQKHDVTALRKAFDIDYRIPDIMYFRNNLIMWVKKLSFNDKYVFNLVLGVILTIIDILNVGWLFSVVIIFNIMRKLLENLIRFLYMRWALIIAGFFAVITKMTNYGKRNNVLDLPMLQLS